MNISESEMKKVKNGCEKWLKMPKIFKWLTIILLGLSLIISGLGLTSCGTFSRINIKSDPQQISISVQQSTNDSTSVNLHLNPTLSYGTKNEAP